jgi:2-keto-3-deoxy-L-rhamnonate aldolase RhmA
MTFLKQRLQQGKFVRVFYAGQLCYPKVIEMVGQHGGYDAIWFDQEHCGVTIPQIEEAARAARSVGLDSFVRLYASDYSAVMKPLEAGAGGLMAAQVRNAQESADIVRWAKFHPQGQRGVNATGIDARYGTMPLLQYMKKANEETFIAVQIERAEAVEEVEKIAAVPGVDVLFVGPADLAQSLGVPAQPDDPRMWKAIERVAEAAKAAGIHWAILPPSVQYAKRCIGLGCRMMSLGLDVWTFQRGLKAVAAEYSELEV